MVVGSGSRLVEEGCSVLGGFTCVVSLSEDDVTLTLVGTLLESVEEFNAVKRLLRSLDAGGSLAEEGFVSFSRLDSLDHQSTPFTS